MSNLKPEEFAANVKSCFRKYFKHAYITSKVQKGLGYYVYICFGIQRKEKWFNGYFENDPAGHKIMVHLDDEGNFKAGEGLDLVMGSVVHVTPAPDSYMAYDSVKIGWRKKTATPEKMLLHMDKYFEKMLKVVEANQDKIKQDLT